MSGTDPQDLIQWEEALRWIGKADQDLRAARLLLDAIPEQAAFHAQQALEKTLKALLVARCQDVRKTHDISTLVVLVRPHWPTLIADPFPLEALTSWYIGSRYPEVLEAMPSVREVSDALDDVQALIQAVMHVVPPELRQAGA